MSTSITPNQREVIAAQNTVSGSPEYITSTSGKLNVNATASLAGSNVPITSATTAVAVGVVDGSGNQITSFGGGTQYVTGTAEATPTGTLSLGWDGTDVKALPLDASGFLKVNVAAGGGSGGTSSSFGSAFPATGTAIGATDGTNMQSLKVDASKNLLMSLQTAIPAGTNVIGHVITDSGSVMASTQSGTWNITNISGTVSLPTGAATSANQTTGNTSLGNIDTNTTNIPNVIGTAAAAIPSKLLQIGGSDGTNARAVKTNTSGQLDIRPLTSSDSVTVANSTLAVTQSGTWNITNVSGTVSLPTGASTSANQTNGSQKSQIVDGSGNVIASTSNALNTSVTNTSLAVTQSGTWTVQPGNTANTTPWLVEQSSTIPVTIQTVGIAASTSGDNTLIAAQGVGKVIYVFAWNLSFSGTVNAKFTDGAAGTLLSGLYYGVANAGGGNSITPPYYLWKGTANTALVLNLSGATAVGGSVSYFVI